MTTIELLQEQPQVYLSLAAVLGLIVGSFLNVVILRLPVMMERQWRKQCAEFEGREPAEAEEEERFDLSRPASHCPGCGHKIRFWENIPVLSYLLLRGRCSECKMRIPLRYPAVEALTAVLTVAVAWHYGPGTQALAAAILTWALVALSVIDADHQLLPDNITLPLLWLGLALSLFGVFTNSHDAIVGAVAGYMSLWLVFHSFRLLTGKEGMGYGDFKLLALLGAWTGWQGLFPIVLTSSLLGALVGVSMVAILGRDRQIPIPFGPYLAMAGWITLLWGQQIRDAYLHWAGLGN
ncbi:MAG: prepilin peptidase [Gammaproteobacteria bacterium]|nr:prepilin peptidase [Gammaproteobacteria bacterium]